MSGYVNHVAVRELFDYAAAEPDPVKRFYLLLKLRDDISNEIVTKFAVTMYEMKATQGWTVGEMAEALDTSERKVKAIINWHIANKGAPDIMRPRPLPDNVVDISSVVVRKDLKTPDRQAVSIPKTLEQVFAEETDLEEQANHS
jgi:hypothetical protein